MSEQDLIDLDEELDEETEEAEFISSSDGFMDHMEQSLNEDILARQGIEMVGRSFKFTGVDGKEYMVTHKQKLFAEAYLEHKGNSVDAVISAGYDVRKKDNEGNPINNVYNRKLAAVIGSQNLSKLNICAYIQILYARYGFTDEAVEREHLFLINQHSDLKTKAKAIDMFYNLKAKYPAKKMDLTSLGEQIMGINYVTPTGNQSEPAKTGNQGDSDNGQA